MAIDIWTQSTWKDLFLVTPIAVPENQAKEFLPVINGSQ